MEAGKLNNLITIQAKSIVPDGDGYNTETWVDIATVSAAILTTGGGEFYAAQKVNAETACLFKIRYMSNINTRMRIKYGYRIFEILGINNVDGGNRQLQISAKEVV